MIEEIQDSKQASRDANNFYGVMLVTLVKDMKLSIAHQRIKECVTALSELGYSKQELTEYIKKYLKDE